MRWCEFRVKGESYLAKCADVSRPETGKGLATKERSQETRSSEEAQKGSIQAGKLADLVVLSQDILQVDPFAIKDIPIEETMIGGEVVFEG